MNVAPIAVWPPELMQYMLSIPSSPYEMISCIRRMRLVSKEWAKVAFQMEFELQRNKKTKLTDWVNFKFSSPLTNIPSLPNKAAFLIYVGNCPNQMKILDLRQVKNLNNADIKKMLNAQANLESVKVDCLLTDETVRKICKLQFLKNFQYRYNLIHKMIKEICSCRPSLESFFLQGPYLRKDHVTALQSLTRLQKLTLKNCFGVEEPATIKMIQAHTKLRVLKMIGSDITENTLTGLSKLMNLQKLSLLGCKKIKTLMPLAELTNLKTLTLGGISHIKSYKEEKFLLKEKGVILKHAVYHG